MKDNLVFFCVILVTLVIGAGIILDAEIRGLRSDLKATKAELASLRSATERADQILATHCETKLCLVLEQTAEWAYNNNQMSLAMLMTQLRSDIRETPCDTKGTR